MSTNGETADLMVREGIQITESALKLAGLGAKNLAALLIALANDNQKLAGKTNLKRLIHDGEELTIFSVKQEDLKGFQMEAKRYGVLFYPIVNKVEKTGTVEIMAKARDAKQINRIFERMGYPAPVKEDIAKNPFENTTLPKIKRKPREIWDAATIRKALDECKDGRLYVAINLSFACSLRIGEIVGLTWDNIHISDADIASDNAYLCVEKELVRVREDSLAVLGEEEIIKKFPRTMYLEDASTVIVLKTPKTESSVRKVWMPKTVAYILREWKASQDKQKEFLGSEYLDYNLVVALPNGRPCEETVISNAFRRLKRDAQLPDVVFHSLRHSSTTYKLKLNHGDIKATQGDTGHSQADMVTKVYAHILDEDRKVNAQKFESAFYANPDLRGVQAPAEPAPALDVQSIILQLQQSPELLSALTSLISNQGCK